MTDEAIAAYRTEVDRHLSTIANLRAHCDGREAALRILSDQYVEARADLAAAEARIAAALKLVNGRDDVWRWDQVRHVLTGDDTPGGSSE